MLSLTRCSSAKSFDATLALWSRQNLPRPARFARLYSVPSRKLQAEALATASPPPVVDYPSYMPAPESSKTATGSQLDGVRGFLRQGIPYTFLPAPLPDDVAQSSQEHHYYYPTSQTQDSLAIIDACLHDCFDVPRARFVFKELRQRHRKDPLLEPRLYNLFLEKYLEMALEKDKKDRDYWLEELWSLYEAMENEQEVETTAGTYAIVAKAMLNLENKISPSFRQTPSDLLSNIVKRQISVKNVIADRVLSADDVTEVIQLLSQSAARLGLSQIVNELGQIEADPVSNFPEVMPVRSMNDGVIPLTSDLSAEALQEIENSVDVSDPDANVPFNIRSLRRHLAEVVYARRALPEDNEARQRLLETSAYDVAVARLRHVSEKLDDLGLNTGVLRHAHLQKWMYVWHEKLQRKLEIEIARTLQDEKHMKPDTKETKTNMRFGPFLTLLKPSKLSLITILELMRLQGTGGVNEGMKTARALLTVGKAVELEYKAEVLKKHNVPIPLGHTPNDVSYFTMKAFDELREKRRDMAIFVENTTPWTSDWTHAMRAKIGSFLVDCLVSVAEVERTAVNRKTGETVTENQPAFYHSYEYLRGRKLGVIRLNPVVSDRLDKDDIRSTLHPRQLPMLVKPKAWVDHNNGGYIYSKTSIMRLKDTQEQLTYLRHACENKRLELLFAGLDVLGSTPWKINKDIFETVLKVWNLGKRFGKMPPAELDIPEPEKPLNCDTDQATKAAYTERFRSWQAEKANNHSIRCSVNYKLEIARAFLSDTFYLPHNIDFRGRAYPIPPHLNHMGDDLSRCLLVFAEAKPLGESGLRWLKIHLANLFGYDKASFDERVEFVHEHLNEIRDSAEKPLDGNGWWTKADEPWQCLAACTELIKALDSGDPENFLSSLPVHQDGTCNGLQHYAALGGDVTGARQVNLDVTDRPADVYTHVANMVDEVIKKDAEKGIEIATLLTGKVSRKVVKQTVMTTVYGVTFVGARAQIERQLRARGDIPAEKIWEASSYLAKHVLSCIGNLFYSAKSIQDWLIMAARLISKAIPSSRMDEALKMPEQKKKRGPAPKVMKSPVARLAREQMTTVIWTTPVGLPVVQPYRKTKRKQILTGLQTVYISDPNSPSEVSAGKQMSAFPPNFIHSLDATHMILTALECQAKGLSFASVHDSYWTHAATVDTMNEVIRDTFIALHESDVLARLREEFLERYSDYRVPIYNLRGSTVSKKLKSLISAGKVKALAEIDEEGSDLDLNADLETDMDQPKERVKSKALSDEGDELSLINAENDYFDEDGTKKVVASKFVYFKDLLPPIPEKGNFDVGTVKKSKYFFS